MALLLILTGGSVSSSDRGNNGFQFGLDATGDAPHWWAPQLSQPDSLDQSAMSSRGNQSMPTSVPTRVGLIN